uniref:Uncharacterized protein n=1 Tax=Plectus sambesii TaxID=2011161 RepID=A0A914WUR4_9BILA
MLFIALLLLCFERTVGAGGGDCPKLLWNKKLNMGYGEGLQLQVCCNVTEVSIHQLDSKKPWSISGSPLRRQLTNEEQNVWSELQLSVCNDTAEPSLGFVQPRRGVTCTYPQGQVISVSPDMFEMNQWYVICYKTADDCSYCHFEVLCDNEFSMACGSAWMQSSASVVTNDSMVLWVRVGDELPFVQNSILKITVIDQSTKRVVSKYTKNPQSNRTIDITINELVPGNYYKVETCLDISPPSHFQDTYHFSMDSTKPICQEGAYRTMSGRLANGSSSLFQLNAFTSMFEVFSLLFLLLLCAHV